ADPAAVSGLLAADVFHPWIPAPSSSADADRAPFMWHVLPAAAAHTSGPLGAVLTPNYRWHPAMIAQASATLAATYPGRHWLGLSAGAGPHDANRGAQWPRPAERVDAWVDGAGHRRKIITNSAAGRGTRTSGARARRRAVSRRALARALGGGGAQRRHHRRALAAPAGADRRDVRGRRPHPQTINELRRRPGHPYQRDPRPPRRGPAVDIAARPA